MLLPSTSSEVSARAGLETPPPDYRLYCRALHTVSQTQTQFIFRHTHFQKNVHNSLLILHSLLVILKVFKSLQEAKH